MTGHPLDVGGIVELAVVERSGLIESRHLGAAIVLAPDGAVLAEFGDSQALVYGRSTLKFMQSVAVQRAGVTLEGAQLVLSAASHPGSDRHVAVVEQILAAAGLGEDSLQCPADFPADPVARRAATQKRRLAMNCSGKHASFLLACVLNGWPTESYLDPAHPLQSLILSTVEEFTGAPVEHAGVDGCGAPVFAVTLAGLARSMSRVIADPAGARLASAIRADPWALDSPEVAQAIDALGVVAKNGAEGVFVAVTPDGTSVALKIMDGSTRASIAIGISLLERADSVDAAAAARVIARSSEPVLGGGLPVGGMRVTAGMPGQ